MNTKCQHYWAVQSRWETKDGNGHVIARTQVHFCKQCRLQRTEHWINPEHQQKATA